MKPYLLLMALVALDIWATRFVSRSTLPPRVRGLLITFVWMVPLLGAWIAVSQSRTPKVPKAPDPPPDREPAPGELSLPVMPPFSIAENLLDGQGFPILDWKKLADWSASAPTPEQASAAIELGRRAWLLHMRESLSEYAHLLETGEAWVLSSYETKVALAAARFVATARQRISGVLDGVARFPAGSRSILVVFDNQDQYYRYVTNYYPEEGEFAFSSGIFVDPGCPHFVTVLDDLATIEPVIAHEMTHSALAYLGLPRWLDEGIAVSTEQQVSMSHRYPSAQIELMNKHREFWNTERMQEFWSGESFHRTDDGNSLSYDLARSIVALTGREWPTFTKFVLAAKRADAGAAAAMTALNLDLGELAAAALRLPRQADWSPNPSAWRGPVS